MISPLDIDHQMQEGASLGGEDVAGLSLPDCTLLISSCDRYADLWIPYFTLLRRRWSDCPFPVVLITEDQFPAIQGVRALGLGSGLDWSSLMIRALDAIDSPYVLLTLEDFFLRKEVDSARILALFEEVQRKQLRMLRLIPRPGPTTVIPGVSEYGAIASTALYRVSTQASFWHVETLRQLLVIGETAWEFEVNGTKRSGEYDGFAAVWLDALPYWHHVVERGKWFPWDAWQFSRLDIGVNLSARSVMSMGETVRYAIHKTTGRYVARMPKKLRRALKPLARLLGMVG